MKVKSGAKVSGSSQSIEIELSEQDMMDVEGWDEIPVGKKWQKMTQRADMLIVEYMMRNGHISSEYAAQRRDEILGVAHG